jgi:asparagine synthase (glutamine-hydrolysing)
MGFPFPLANFFQSNRKIIELIIKNSKNKYVNYCPSSDFGKNWRMISFILWYELFFNRNLELFKGINAETKPFNAHQEYGFTPEFFKSCRVN